ncbi:MAG: HPr family phosphocarrier protein [Nitrospinae bacterium]|nr:HPr family phosphocarrier protein [Nitrospinota bacterium]
MKPKSLVKIISEEEFLILVKEPSAFFFKIYNSFTSKMESGKDVSRKFYSNLIQEAEFLESFLDEFGARENKEWSFFTEYVACIRNLGISAFFIKHLLDRYPYYSLRDSEESFSQFQSKAKDALHFLNRSILNIYQEVIHSSRNNGLVFPEESVSPHEFAEIESNKRLPKNIAEDEVKNEDERIVEICQKVQEVARKMEKIKIPPTDDLKALKNMVPFKINETRARAFKEMVHSVQSDYDTYVKRTKFEEENSILKNLRGHISMTLHLLEVVLWLSHFYERHEDEIRAGECKRKIAEMVDKGKILSLVVNFGFQYSLHFIRKGSELAEDILKQFIKVDRIEVPIPKPLGFHARPSTYISLIARRYNEDLFLVVDDEKFSSKSVMSMLQAGGNIADKGYQTVIFEGSKRVLDDIKILAKHNYCEEQEIPHQLIYLKELRDSA